MSQGSRPAPGAAGVAAAPSTPQDATDADALLAQHREALRAQFPLPDLTELAAQSAARARRRRRVPAPALALTLIGTAIAALLWADPAYRTEHLVTAAEAPRTVHLADGSRLVLDRATTVEVSWHLRSRRAALRQGRALFAVAPSWWRPLTVALDPAQVHVTGTVFTVARDADSASVSLHEGRVRVTPGAGQATVALLPGHRLTLPNGAAPTVQTIDAAQSRDWEHGQLVLENVPLAEALARIQRYRARPLHLAPGAPAGLRVSGVLDVSDPDILLRLLPHVWPVRIEQRPDGTAWVHALLGR